MMELFKEKLLQEEKSEATIEKYLRDVKKFLNFLNGRKIEKMLVMEYKEKLEKEYSVTSANSMIAALNSFFRFIGVNQCCVKQFKIQKKIFCLEEKELNRRDYIKLVETAKRKGNKRLNMILQTICGTGMRVSELQHITVEAVKQGVVNVSCKNKIRTILIVQKLRKKILGYIKEMKISSGCVFITKTGNPVNRCNIWREMKELCEEAGVSKEKVFPHNLRHLFARVFYSIEKDIVKLADILGHSSVNTTRIYMISTGSEHRKKMERMRLII